jgi:excisionase family DNA binding protein
VSPENTGNTSAPWDSECAPSIAQGGSGRDAALSAAVSIRVELELNGARVPVMLGSAAVAAIAAAVARNEHDEGWPDWMGVETTARYLDVSPERVRKLIAARRIPYSQEAPGCRVFMRRSALDGWMESMACARRRMA